MGGKVYFAATDRVRGRELWRTDGTRAGTVLVKNIRPDSPGVARGSRPQDLTVVRGTLYFTADDGTRGRELWKSDGTRAGTVLVKNISAGGSASPLELTRVGRRLFFTAKDGKHGRELWRSNGTRAGTVLVKDIAPVSHYYSGHPRELTAMPGLVYFTAADGRHNRELWKSDGTRAGTAMVKDISRSDHPDAPGEGPSWLTPFDGRLFFSASPLGNEGARDWELWASDGTSAGTTLVKDINPATYAPDYDLGSDPARLTAAGSRLFFTAEDTHGQELWASDGTAAGTTLVADIAPGFAPTEGPIITSSDPESLTAVGEQLYFVADDGQNGRELWTSHGTVETTSLVEDLWTLEGFGSDPRSLVRFGAKVAFTADDGVNRRELWTSDGTAEGTSMVTDIATCGGSEGSNPAGLTVAGDRVYFSADDGAHGRELWSSDGTAEGTRLVKDLNRASTP